MKRFVKTLPGKVLLFILCTLMLCAVCAGIIAALFMIGKNMYNRSEKQVAETILQDRLLYYEVYPRLYDSWFPERDIDYTHLTPDPAVNVLIKVTDTKGNVILADDGYESLAGDICSSCTTYCIRYPNSGFTFNWDGYLGSDDEYSTYYQQYDSFRESEYDGEGANASDLSSEEMMENGNSSPYSIPCIAEVALRKDMTAKDTYYYLLSSIHAAYSVRGSIYIICAVSLLLFLLLFCALMAVSGRRPDKEEVYPGPLNIVPFDLLAAAAGFAGCFVVFAPEGFINGLLARGLWMAAAVVLFSALFVGLCMSLAARIKQKTLIRNSLLGLSCRGIWILIKKLMHGISLIPLVWRTAVILFLVTVAEFFVLVVFFDDAGMGMVLLWFLEKLVVVPGVLYLAVSLRRLQRGGQALANGDLSYQTDTRLLFWDFKRHAENLNRVAEGMSTAVEQRLKSERMKTELITNVSHDLKTPLTSILNYARLIEQEPCDNPKITEYAGVLSRQSARLKRLIEDLVEASKASTGNLEVVMEPCDASVLLAQAAGEYEDKLAESGLSMVMSVPQEPVTIMADGRRLWRVFDNLMNNARKYSLPGTRVYLTLEQVGQHAVISMKNISREPLNMTEDELMERFVRGDSSRNTEGNGLGLSIARSLTELQKGSLNLTIDGDLFKAVLTFPIAETE